MKRTTPELVHPSPNFCTTPAGKRLNHVRLNVHQAHKRGGSPVGFQPLDLRLRRGDFTTRPSRLPVRSHDVRPKIAHDNSVASKRDVYITKLNVFNWFLNKKRTEMVVESNESKYYNTKTQIPK
ncbi:hypothetical protein AVEN_210517-1 [Araneus ventricosus]|uniref:Homeobox domain-containing protein n=1 Tax=Araneus ventricosus TaxID=182803 RepID=A0A4Y2FB89_ARAVE|nr:hypothetical protein AVEN_210517-1 [Araneus ventricosus]